MAKDYYKILGISELASRETIKKAYRDAVKKLHPDSNQGVFDKKRFCDIQEAYEAIKDAMEQEQRDSSDTTRLKSTQPFFWFESPQGDLFRRMGSWSEVRGAQENLAADRKFHNVELILSREEARRGGKLTLHVPLKTPCEFCGGTGSSGFFVCLFCGGTGETTLKVPVTFVIPPGVIRGAWLKVPFETKQGEPRILRVLIDVRDFY
ncbi:MAG: DnaJ domain-containing protein [Nitrospiraceae bacterium]|nr:DnaJ domain-containing protein [Nitrospiraceae bacterium]